MIEQLVQFCLTCQRVTVLHREPLLATPLSSYPWERVAADLFKLKVSTYLLYIYYIVADSYFRFVEVQKLTTTTSSSIVTQLKAIFTRFGISITVG